jgi:hypothetical protein
MNGDAYIPLLVALETDATRFHGENAVRPALLDQGGTGQVLAHLAADLASLFPGAASFPLAMPGALFDQTQLLRPGFPVYRRLENQLQANPETDRLGLGADHGKMPWPELEPETAIPLGTLLLLPLVIGGPGDAVREIATQMEHRFLESGQVSAHTAQGLEAHFGVSVNHARFMTVTDLHAMLRLQLEHFGFLPLWELLYAALDEEPGPRQVTGGGGQRFEWRDGAVHCQFETFDHWANDGTGREHPAAGQLLARNYADWVREYRQYLTTLQAHGVPVVQRLAGAPGRVLGDSFLVEESRLTPGKNAAQVTEHSLGELGTVAVTVIRAGRQLNYYPLLPAGLNELHAHIRESGQLSGAVSFPGCISYGERERRLVPDTLPPGDG